MCVLELGCGVFEDTGGEALEVETLEMPDCRLSAQRSAFNCDR